MLFKNSRKDLLLITRNYFILFNKSSNKAMIKRITKSQGTYNIWKITSPKDANEVVAMLRNLVFNYRLCYDSIGIIGSDLYYMEKIGDHYIICKRNGHQYPHTPSTNSNLLRAEARKILKEIQDELCNKQRIILNKRLSI